MTRRTASILLTVLALLVAAPSAAATLLGLVPRLQVRHLLLAQASAFLHLGAVGWLLVLTLALAAALLHRGRAAALALVTSVLALVVHASWLAPYLRADDRPATPVLGITTLNVEVGETDVASLVPRLAGSDVVALQEATPETVLALTRAGMDKRFPHRVGNGAPTVRGTVLYSRFPLADLGMGPTIHESRLVRVAAPGGPVLVAAVHPVPPITDAASWVVDAAQLHSWLRPHLSEDMVVAGDFNAIDRHLTMQPYWGSGFRDAAETAGAGPARTWPTDGGVLPVPLVGIDHVLVSPRLTATRHELLRVPGTDHAGVRVTVGRH